MTRTIPAIAALVVLTLVAGCAGYVLVDGEKPREVGGVLRVDPQIDWSSIKNGNSETWTVDGAVLEAITFTYAIKDGDPLLPLRQGEKKEDVPTYRDGMRATDVVDLFEAQLIARRYSQIETRGLRPQDIGGASGFRFEFSAFNVKGLAKRGFVVGLIDPEQGLSLAIFEAAAEHYYDKYADEAEAVFTSMEKI